MFEMLERIKREDAERTIVTSDTSLSEEEGQGERSSGEDGE
jgi:hypothetical protein